MPNLRRQQTLTTYRRGFRDPLRVRSVVLRMGTNYIEQLDLLCEANGDRSRRKIIETLVAEAYKKFMNDPTVRIDPL